MKNNLYTLLKADEKQVRKIVVAILKENGYEPIVRDHFIYAEGSIPVMLCAHYDTVPTPPKYIKNNEGVLTGWRHNKRHGLGADDRAGIYAILETIVNHHCHVLFTGGEESGGIGAFEFSRFVDTEVIKPNVNYCIQLDRRGENDAVYYDGDNEDFEKFITEHGWQTAIGSFTDICEVCPTLGVMGVNLSIGYTKEHTTEETLDTEVMNRTIKRIPELLDGEKYEYKEKAYSYRNWYKGIYRNGYGWDYGYGDYGYGGYYGYGKSAEPAEEELYYIMFKNERGNEEIEESLGLDLYGAIGYFLMEHETLTYNDIIEVFDEHQTFLENTKKS